MIKRLQGTDGIRGRIQLSKDCSIEDPVQAFTKLGVLTESFFELYTYAFCQELLSNSYVQTGDSLVIGWDPRDKTGLFNQTAIDGILKSGLNVISLEMAPTPMIALYLMQVKAFCAIVLTASHNPSDQNGIKIFLGYSGLKLFPVDDTKHTKRIFDLKYAELKNLPKSGKVENHSTQAEQFFIDFSLAPANSWFDLKEPFEDTVIIDATNGAFSNLAKKVFTPLSLSQLIFTNCDLSGEINLNSGVADLEGNHEISTAMIEDSSGSFYHYETLQTLLREGRKQQEALKNNSSSCTAFVFDGDGDRFFRLDYDPFQDNIIVSTGDQIAYWQLLFSQQRQKTKNLLFVNTVESDLEVVRSIQKEGFDTFLAAVGDKWILWQAFLEHWNGLKPILASANSTALNGMIQELEGIIRSQQETSEFESLKITKMFQQIMESYLNETKISVQDLNQKILTRFVLGSEESGHVVSRGELQESSQSVYVGNGLKSALNTMVAIKVLRPNSPKEFYSWLRSPYPKGFQKSMPVYYVNKSLLQANSKSSQDIQSFLRETIQKQWPSVTAENVYRPEEPEMTYLLLTENKSLTAALFLRNSGTEDKMSLYLRGKTKDTDVLASIGEEVYRHLLLLVKNKDNMFAIEEKNILKQLSVQPMDSASIHLQNEKISKNRLLHEMHARQGLILLKEGKWEVSDRALLLINED